MFCRVNFLAKKMTKHYNVMFLLYFDMLNFLNFLMTKHYCLNHYKTNNKAQKIF